VVLPLTAFVETRLKIRFRWNTHSMLIFKRPGRNAQVRFMPGCLIWSLILSVALTVLVNLLIRLL
jgi:hypothetical protein